MEDTWLASLGEICAGLQLCYLLYAYILYIYIYRYTLAGQKLCLLSLCTANPFPLESFSQRDSDQISPREYSS